MRKAPPRAGLFPCIWCAFPRGVPIPLAPCRICLPQGVFSSHGFQILLLGKTGTAFVPACILMSVLLLPLTRKSKSKSRWNATNRTTAPHVASPATHFGFSFSTILFFIVVELLPPFL